ncbi:MAG: LysM peptidoglycan-binding domain-containing protein [Campylobacterales bacterium]
MVKRAIKGIFGVIIAGKLAFASLFTTPNLETINRLDINYSFLKDRKLRKIYDRYLYNRKKILLRKLAEERDMISIIRREITQRELPKSLFYLAVAESLLKANEQSRKGAKGVWQFIRSTARNFGLRIDGYIDERKDPVKSTQVALKYLSYLHRLLGKWYLVIMAYNAGEGRVIEGVVRAKVDKLAQELGAKNPQIVKYRHIIKRYQRNPQRGFSKLYALFKELKEVPLSVADLMRIQPHLDRQYIPKETRNYLRRVLALNLLFNNPRFIDYDHSYLLNPGSSPSFVKVDLPPGTPLIAIAKSAGISVSELRRLNPQLRRPFLPPYKYYVYLPYRKLAHFRMNFSPTKVPSILRYVVKKGDSLYRIAKKFGVSLRELQALNGRIRYLRPGQTIVIPLKSAYLRYRVKRGDSLSKIAHLFHVSPKVLKEFNNLRREIVREGQILVIPQRG